MRQATAVEIADMTLRYPDHGTFFDLETDSNFRCKLLMPPWLDDRADISRIPKSTYTLDWVFTEHHGYTWLFQDTVGREGILLHPGNFAGIVSKGYAADSEGCGLLGADVALFKKGGKYGKNTLTKDQWGVTSSEVTWQALKADMNAGPFQLTLK